MIGLLKKISEKENALRTNEVSGNFPNYPEVGKSFIMYADAIDPKANLRVVTTSTVQEVSELFFDTWRFRTRNSLYEIQVTD